MCPFVLVCVCVCRSLTNGLVGLDSELQCDCNRDQSRGFSSFLLNLAREDKRDLHRTSGTLNGSALSCRWLSVIIITKKAASLAESRMVQPETNTRHLPENVLFLSKCPNCFRNFGLTFALTSIATAEREFHTQPRTSTQSLKYNIVVIGNG